MNASIKARIAALQALSARQQSGVAIMALLEDGAWSASKGPRGPARIFQSERDAQKYLANCETVIVVDV